MSAAKTYLGLLSRVISSALKKQGAEGSHIIQSTIHLEEEIDGLHLVCIGAKSDSLDSKENVGTTFMVAFTPEDLEVAGQRYKKLQEDGELPRISTLVLKAAIDLSYEDVDHYTEDRIMTDEKILDSYSGWDLLKLSLVSFLR